MHPLVAIALVLSTALLWGVFTVLMLARVNRAGRRALTQQRKDSRMKTRAGVRRHIPDGTGGARRHHFKVWRRHPSSPLRRVSTG